MVEPGPRDACGTGDGAKLTAPVTTELVEGAMGSNEGRPVPAGVGLGETVNAIVGAPVLRLSPAERG